jgi:hypothetical protein
MANNYTLKDYVAAGGASPPGKTFKSTETTSVHVPHHNVDEIAAGENHIGTVTGAFAVVSANFTRPADTLAYASGDLVANSTTAASVTPMTFAGAARVSTGKGRVKRAKIKKSSTSLTNASFRLHLYTITPSTSSGIINGDNGVWLTKENGWIGSIDVTIDKAFNDAADGIGVATVGVDVPFAAVASDIYGLLEARGAYTPASAEVYTVTIDVEQA